MRDDAPVHGTRRTVASAVVAAVRLLRARWKAVLVTVLCIYAALSWTMPLMTSLVRATLAALGISGVNLYTLDTVAASPWALLVLVGIAGAATLFALLELTLFAAIAHLVLEGERLTFTRVAGRAGATARKAAGWQGLLLIPYLTVLLPVSGAGFSSVLTERVALPKFVTGELLKSTPGAALYIVVGGAVTYLMLRLLLVPGLVSLPGVTIAQALRGSLRMTTWRMLLGFGAVMLSTLLVATVILLPLAGVGLLPVALLQTHAAAGAALGVLELARNLVAGAAAAFVSFFLVAYLRLLEGRPVEVPSTPRARPATKAAALTLVALAGFVAIPRVVAAAEAAVLASQSSPMIIGHRGYPAEAVENSIAGLRAAEAAGADMVETDIQETRDGGLVVMHDVGLGRLTGVDRDVHELTTDEVTALTLRQGGRTAPVPTLAEMVREADALDVRLLVELKPHGHEQPGFARRVAAELGRLDPDRTHMVQALDRDLVEQIARIDPDRPTAYVVGFQIGDLPTTSTGAVVIEDWSFHDRMLVEAHAQGRDLYTWTVNDLGALTDHLARGVDGVITDEVSRAVEVRERLASGPLALYVERARGLVAIGQ